MFRTMDTNEDGILSPEEMRFGFIRFAFCSGPDDPYSGVFGPIVDE